MPPTDSRGRRGLGILVGSTLVALLLTHGMPLHAQTAAADFPNRPLKVIVPLGPGSGGDGYGRLFADKMTALLGQIVVVENMPGAGGTVAALALKRAPADGYTILLATAGLVSGNPIFVRDLPYEPTKDFASVAGVARGMNVFVVPSTSAIKTVPDLVAAAKRAHAPINCGTVSPVYQLAQEWFAKLAGTRFAHVPYKAAGPLINDVAGGQLDLAVTDLASAAPLIRAGRIRALAVTGAQRHPDFPDVPTVKESGYRDYTNYAWAAFYVRAETPAPLVKKLADAVLRVQGSSEARELASRFGGELMPMGSAELRRFQQEELERFRAVAKSAGIEPQ
jgi:tripartite-type tricarboxylate transporter receptor subunit TctC